jgi:hypothetical protein
MAQLERRLPKGVDHSYFLKFAKDLTSQGGEDGILEEIFRLLSCSPNRSFPKHCVDIGAWDGNHLSNTFTLLNSHGWSGLLVEAELSRFEILNATYATRENVHCVSQLVDFEGENSLKSLMRDNNVPVDMGFLCIDVDGADYHLWKSISDEFRPIVVCIEFNPTIPNDVFFVQAPQINIQQGSSLLAIKELADSLGYVLAVTTTFNAIFVRADWQDCLPMHLIPQDINILHVPFMTTEMFQTYDGELKYVGTKKLLWHKVALSPQKLQVMAKKDRVYPFAPTSAQHLHICKIDALCEDLRKSIQDQNVEMVSKFTLSLLDLSQSPVLEVVVMEKLNKSYVRLTLQSISTQTTLLSFLSLIDVLIVRCHGSFEIDLEMSMKILNLATSVFEWISSNGLADHVQVKSTFWRIQAEKIRYQRLRGEWFLAWVTLQNVTIGEADELTRKVLEKEKLKLVHLLDIPV